MADKIIVYVDRHAGKIVGTDPSEFRDFIEQIPGTNLIFFPEHVYDLRTLDHIQVQFKVVY